MLVRISWTRESCTHHTVGVVDTIQVDFGDESDEWRRFWIPRSALHPQAVYPVLVDRLRKFEVQKSHTEYQSTRNITLFSYSQIFYSYSLLFTFIKFIYYTFITHLFTLLFKKLLQLYYFNTVISQNVYYFNY